MGVSASGPPRLPAVGRDPPPEGSARVGSEQWEGPPVCQEMLVERWLVASHLDLHRRIMVWVISK